MPTGIAPAIDARMRTGGCWLVARSRVSGGERWPPEMARKSSQDKLLGEWFWTDRWMGSSAFLLPMEPRGVYREMLTQAWRRGARLPNDHETIRRAIGCTDSEWKRCWP